MTVCVVVVRLFSSSADESKILDRLPRISTTGRDQPLVQAREGGRQRDSETRVLARSDIPEVFHFETHIRPDARFLQAAVQQEHPRVGTFRG